jgi:class 3 adenylate cyclase
LTVLNCTDGVGAAARTARRRRTPIQPLPEAAVTAPPEASPLVEGHDERRHLTVLFSDLVGSTELASSMDPEDWHDVLTAYQAKLAQLIAEHGGVVAQFQGDGVVAYFGYPEARDTAGRDAVTASLAITEAVRSLGRELPPALSIDGLAARVGVHTGEVVMAAVHVGGAPRIADVFGEVTNLAARLQGAGGPGDVLVSDTTARLVAGYFVTESIGDLTLKGISRPIATHRVVRHSAARGRLEAGPLTGYVARQNEAEWLEAHWRWIQNGSARMVLVTGEAGIGKSRLLREFAATLSDAGHDTLFLYCGHLDSLSPLRPFVALMGALPMTPDVAAQWVLEQAERTPLLLLVEDAHWADPSTIEAVEQVAKSERPVLVVLTARPEIEAPGQIVAADRLNVDRLGPTQALSVIARVPGSEGVPADIRRDLVQRADGVPLFLEELTRGYLHQPHDAEPGSQIPVTLSEVIAARLDRMGVAKGVAQAAAIVGRAFDRVLLQSVVALEPHELDQHLQHLVDQAVVEPSEDIEGRFRFRHTLIREAAYSSVLRAERRRAHGAVADALLTPAGDAPPPEVVAYHLGAAGRSVEAVEMWRDAARAARQHSRFREAAGHEREILELLPSLPADLRDAVELGSRSRLMMCLTAVDQAAPDILTEGTRVQELARLADDRKTLLRTYLVLLPWWQANADYHSIDTSLPESQQLALELEDSWSQQILQQFMGAVRIWQGRAAEGVGHLEASFDAVGVPLDSSLEGLSPQALPVVGIVLASTRIAAALGCWLTGRVTDADRIRAETLRFAAQLSVPQAEAVTAATGAIIAQLDGDRELVTQLTSAAAGTADEVRNRQWQQWAAVLRWWSGDAAEELEVPGPLLRPYFLMLLADRKDVAVARASALLDEALETVRTTGERFCEAEVLRVRAAVLARAGDVGAAATDLHEAIEVAVVQGARLLELRARTDLFELQPMPDTRAGLDACLALLADERPCRSTERAAAALASR